MTYIPPPYRPRLFPRAVRWLLIAAGCTVFLVWGIAMMWLLDAVWHS